MKHITFKYWHNFLDMPKYTKKWHEDDIAAEYAELDEAENFVDRWSEYSDVVYTLTRARWSGHSIDSPLTHKQFVYGSLYMFPKYTLRFLFYRRAGKKLNAKRSLHEVRNPKKVHKLHHIAKKYDIDPEAFAEVCEKQLGYWPLLK